LPLALFLSLAQLLRLFSCPFFLRGFLFGLSFLSLFVFSLALLFQLFLFYFSCSSF
jgi:hypothetical protein